MFVTNLTQYAIDGYGSTIWNCKNGGTEQFTAAIRKFMEMETLTAPLLWELIDYIGVYETEGTGKNRTQRICICYRFVGYLEIPVPDDVLLALDMRRGVRVNYTSKAV